MTKRYCDRCGQQIDEGVHAWYVLELHGTDGEFRHKELCEECYEYLCEKDEAPKADRKTEPTSSKMEQVDRDINVRSKDEPKTQMKTQNSNLTFKTLEYCDICDHKGCEECISNALDEHCIPSQFNKQIEDECAKEYEELGLKELKELIEADRKTEPSNSEKPNNCEHITEDGVTCAKYPACDDCLDNPLNKVKCSERLVKGSEVTTDCRQLERSRR